MTKQSWNYRRAGVDLDKHRLMHRAALNAIEETMESLKLEIGGLGSYAAWFKLGEKRLALHIDGVGTKTLVLEAMKRLWVAGWDCVAMNVNDLAVAGFKPLVLVDYIAMPSSDEEAFKEIIRGLKDAAKKSGVAIIGGETAILPDLAKGFDVACAVLGEQTNNDYKGLARPNDILLGVESNGLHANGYSLARKIIEQSLGSYNTVYRGINLGEELSKPTHVYSNLVLSAIEEGLVNAAAHITGGAFTKLGRILGGKLYAEIEAPEPPLIFRLLMELGNIGPREMYRVFNMGIGLIFSVSEDRVDKLQELVQSYGFRYFVLGRVRPGSPRIIINTPWGDIIEYKI